MRRSFRRSVPALVLLLLPQAGRPEALRVFDTESGLTHNRVNSIYLDSRGFLWICTDDGLARFDGHQFASYTTADGLPHKHANALLETRSGEYWVATDGGLSRLDPAAHRTRFTTYAPPGAAEASHVNALIEDSDGSLIAGTSAGLFRFKARARPPAFEAMALPVEAHAAGAVMVNALARDSGGSLWLGANNGLYRQEHNAAWTHYGTDSGLPADRWIGAAPIPFVQSFAYDRGGRLWTAFKGGFGRIAPDPKPGTPVLDVVQRERRGLTRDVRALWFGSDGRRWVATESGLLEWTVDVSGISRFRDHTIAKEFPREAFLSLREDLAGNLWIGTRRSGLVQVAPSPFQTFGADEGLRLGLDQFLASTKSGDLWLIDVGSKRARVYRWDGHRWSAAIWPGLPESGSPDVRVAMVDHKGAWWCSTSAGLYRFPEPGARFDLRLLDGSGAGRSFEDANGDVWIEHWPAGLGAARLARWQRRSGLVHDESARLPENARTGITAFAQDHAGTIWIALQRPSGLLRLRDGRFQPVSKDWSGHINTLFVDSKGRVWATSTDHGLAVIEDAQARNPRLRRYTQADGLSADEVWSVTEDAAGRIYAGTAKGVDRLEPGAGRIVHYSTADGLVRGDIRSAACDRNGNVWFVSAHGVSRLNPHDGLAVAPSRTRITGLRIAGIPFPISEFGESAVGPVRVASHQNSVQINFAATDYRTPSLRYQFRLDGEGGDGAGPWQDPGATSMVHLVNLAPGGFVFRVRALAPGGLAGEPAVFTFTVLEPLWRTWWFQLACAVTIGAAVWWIRTRRLKEQVALERMRSRLAMDLHDDIGAGLSRISVMGEALKSRAPDGEDDVHRMLDDIAGSSRQLIADMCDIVWSLDPGRDQVGDLATRLRAFGAGILEPSGVEWTVEGEPESIQRSLPPALKRQLYLVFREGIHNVAKHAGARRATLRLWLHDGHVWGELTDDGCGTAPRNGDGNGLPSMQNRVSQLGGRLDIRTPASGGRSIRIRVPL